MLRLARFLRPYRLLVGLVLVLTFGQTMATLYLPKVMARIIDNGVVQGNVAYILRGGTVMLVVALGGGLASVLASYYAARATAGFAQLLRLHLFRHVTRYSLGEFDQWGNASLIVRTTNDAMQVQQTVGMSLRMLVMAPLTAVGGIVMAIDTDPRLSLTLAVVLPVLGVAVFLVMRRGLGLFRLIQGKVDRLNRVLRENLTGVRVIRSFGRVDWEGRRFDDANTDLTDTSVEAFELMATMMPLVMLIMNLSSIAIVWFGAREINGLTLQIGQLMAFIQYATQILQSVMMVSMMFFMIPRGQASAQRINEVFDLAPTIGDPQAPRQPAAGVHGRVAFEGVTFRYEGAEEPALQDITFKAAPGEITAIIGGTGSGKSTLLHLIQRFYDVAAGSVRIDGIDVREMTQAELRGRIGYVPQRSVLFTGSVAENVRYGDEEASADAVRHAVDTAQATEFVTELDGGLEAGIQQGGTNLSGGQKQRLAIARALVRRAEVYLFDDSFSALDYGTDARLRAALRRELGSATVLIVAQRVSTVMDADRILVLDEGRLVGTGTHHELMSTCPVYREIVASQLSPEEVA